MTVTLIAQETVTTLEHHLSNVASVHGMVPSIRNQINLKTE